MLPSLPVLSTPLSAAERTPEDVLLVTGPSCECPAMTVGPGWLLGCFLGSGAGAWLLSSMAATDWLSTASSSCQAPSPGLMAAEPARLAVYSLLGSCTAILRGPGCHQALPWQRALQCLAVPPCAGTALTCLWGYLDVPAAAAQELRGAQCPAG